MICLNCKQQIPDDSDRCPNCGTEVFHKEQLAREIGFRRYQRWIFYGLFTLAFVGAVGVVVKVYSLNTKLLLQVADVQSNLAQKETDLAKAKSDLTGLLKTKADLESQNKTVSDSLTAKIDEAQKAVADLTALQGQADQAKARADQYEALLRSAAKVATDISAADLRRIPFADIAYAGPDKDNDGLPDDLEAALGTNASSTDTDGDGYSDRAEFVGGFDPLAAGGKSPIDQAFALKQMGKVFKQDGGYLWFVGSDAKRYFLGKM